MSSISRTQSFPASKPQGGFIIVSMMLLLGALGYTLFVYNQVEEQKRLDEYAQEAGRQFQALAYGTAKYLSRVAPTVTNANYTDSAFIAQLKHSSCLPAGSGTVDPATDFYLACGFKPTNPFGGRYSTSVVRGANGVVTITLSVPFPRLGSVVKANLAARLRMAAAGYSAGAQPDASNFVQFTLDKANDLIVAEVTNRSSNDIWFRTDGSNQMNADANIGGNSLYGVNALYGGATATPNASDTIRVESAMNVLGVLTAENNLDVDGNANVDGYLEVKGGSTNPAGYAAQIDGRTYINGGLVVGTSGRTSSITLENGGVQLRTNSNGDLFITSSTGRAEVIADRFYQQEINRYMYQGVFNLTIAKHNDYIDKPSCPTGSQPQIFTLVSGLAQRFARPMTAFSVRAVDAGSRWRIKVRMRVEESNKDVPASNLMSEVAAIVKCS